MTIGDRVKKLRNEKGLSQEELAQKLGYKHKTSISKIESNNRRLTQPKIQAIAEVFGISPSELLLGTTDDEIPTHYTAEEEELQEYLEELKNRPEMKMLFKTAKNSTKEDIEKTVKIIEALKEQSE